MELSRIAKLVSWCPLILLKRSFGKEDVFMQSTLMEQTLQDLLLLNLNFEAGVITNNGQDYRSTTYLEIEKILKSSPCFSQILDFISEKLIIPKQRLVMLRISLATWNFLRLWRVEKISIHLTSRDSSDYSTKKSLMIPVEAFSTKKYVIFANGLHTAGITIWAGKS